MGTSGKRYPEEYRNKMIELVHSGRAPEGLSKEFEPSAQTIRNWVREAEIEEGHRTDGLTRVERDELTRLRKENRRLKEEREILKKAAAWFAQETNNGSSHS